MSSWTSVVTKNTKKTLKKQIKTHTDNTSRQNSSQLLKPDISEKETALLFEEQYGEYIEDSIKSVFDSNKGTSCILEPLSYVDIEEFFYTLIDKSNSVIITPEEAEEPEYLSNDEEY